MNTLLWTALAFTLGSLPFAYWLGRAFLSVDVRDYGADHNPGAGNAWRAGGWRLGLPAAALDVGKATAAVLLARIAGVTHWGLLPVALAPLFGHALSPFLGFRGGKSVAATFGIWLGLTGPLGALLLAVCFGLVYAVQRTDAWTNVIGSSLFFAGLLLYGAAGVLLSVSLANVLLLAWTSRRELHVPPRPRHTHLLGRRV
jgi:glycerol-3-phosphate acyltransferase PlsY